MKELPDRWCLKITKENQNILSKHYIRSYLNDYHHIGNYISGQGVEFDSWSNKKYYPGIPEISFEDFQRLVLGINVEKGYELW